MARSRVGKRAQSIAALAAGAATSPVAVPLAVGAFGNIAAFLFMTWASVAKPWGSTPWSAQPRRPRPRRTLTTTRPS